RVHIPHLEFFPHVSSSVKFRTWGEATLAREIIAAALVRSHGERDDPGARDRLQDKFCGCRGRCMGCTATLDAPAASTARMDRAK
ncbi:Os03g0779300, partial [Oryza sativa Japonica Group]